jgi:hypothetical protein
MSSRGTKSAVAAAVALACLASAPALGGVSHAGSSSGRTPQWVARYNGPTGGRDEASSVTLDPTSHRVYVTGYTIGPDGHSDCLTLGYRDDGTVLWSRSFNGPNHDDDDAAAITVDSSNHHVYVGGSTSTGTGGPFDFATIAYSAAGLPLWTRTYGSANDGNDRILAMAVDPGNHHVYVTGWIHSDTSEFLTIAYSASGRKLWMRKGGSRAQVPWAITVDRRNHHVYVTGGGVLATGENAFKTIAYSATGTRLWSHSFARHGDVTDVAFSVAVDSSNHQVYVTGMAGREYFNNDYATVAYSRSGKRLWARLYDGPAKGDDGAEFIAVDSIIHHVYVTGQSAGSGSPDVATVAYNRMGSRLWVARYDGPAHGWDRGNAVAVDSRSHNVYVTGPSYAGAQYQYNDYATVAYNRTGNRLWSARYDGPTAGDDVAAAIALDMSKGRVYVTGRSQGQGDDIDFATVAY